MTGLAPRLTIALVVGLVFAGSLSLTSCQGEAFVPEAGFVDLVAELKLATAVCGDDLEKANEARRIILKQHGTAPDKFHRQYTYLMDHPEAWRQFHDQVVERLKFHQKKPQGETHGQ